MVTAKVPKPPRPVLVNPNFKRCVSEDKLYWCTEDITPLIKTDASIKEYIEILEKAPCWQIVN